MSLTKKLLTAVLALFGAICIAAALFFVPAYSVSAEGETEIKGSAHFVIENGEFQGLSADGVAAAKGKRAKIVIPDTVTAIAAGGEGTVSTLFGDAATSVVEISFADATKILTVGKHAFAGLTSLGKINLGEATNLTSIGEGAFAGCKALTLLSVASHQVTAIPAEFALGCAALDTLSLPTEISSVGANAFKGCSSLTSVKLPDTLTALPEGVFYGCNKLASFNADDTSNINLPSAVTTIGKDAFYGCVSLKGALTIPKNVTVLDQNAFYGCSGINTINYLATRATVPVGNPFALPSEAYAASSVTVNIGGAGAQVEVLPARLFSSGKEGEDQDVYEGHRGITQVNFVNVALSGVDGWGVNTFRNCTSLKEVTFAEGCTVTLINQNAFDGCTSLSSIVNSDIEKIGLEGIGLKTISEQAFRSCTSLFSVTVGAEVTAIKSEAFSGCERLIEVINRSSHLTITAGDPDNNGQIAQNAEVVHNEKNTKIQTAGDFKYFVSTDKTYILGYVGSGTEVTVPATYSGKTCRIYKNAFYRNTKIEKITISDGIQYIGKAAFAGCTALTDITFPDTVIEIGEEGAGGSLEGCTSLQRVTFNGAGTTSRLSKINVGMFKGCTALQSVVLPVTVSTIKQSAFENCSALQSVEFDVGQKTGKLVTIGNSAFAGCEKLEAIKLPATVKSVGDNAFKDCKELKAVYLPADVESAPATETTPAIEEKTVVYGQDVFANCHSSLLLISASKEQYGKDKIKDRLKDYADNLTYEVKVHLIYNDGSLNGEHSVNKLYNRDGGLVQSGLRWVTTSSMPTQSGYLISKWYKVKETDERLTDPVDLATFTQMLQDTTAEELTLYAYYHKKPALVGKSDAVFEQGMSYDIEKILINCLRYNGETITAVPDELKTEVLRYSVTKHYFVNGNEDANWSWSSGRITQAGRYRMVIDLQSNVYGQWNEPLEVEFTIKPLEIDISDSIIWRPTGGTGNLAPDVDADAVTLYFYDNSDVPYLEPITGKTPTKTVKVLNSYAVYTGNQIEVRLGWKSSMAMYGTIDDSSYVDNLGTSAGTYNTQVVLRPLNDYKFIYKQQTPPPQKLSQLGLTFVLNGDETMTVSKKWYIVISSANHLAVAGENGEPGGLYSIVTDENGVAWTYMKGGEAAVPTRPTITMFHEEASTLVTFTLKFNDGNGEQIIANKVALGSVSDGFEKYVNSSMPAGNYKLTFFIGEKRNESGEVVTGNPEGETFEFTVAKATLEKVLVDEVTRKLSDTSIAYNGNPQFISTDSISLLDGTREMQATRRGIWQTEIFDKYYTDFEIGYVVKKGEKKNFASDPAPEEYFPKEDYPMGDYQEIPVSIGSYTVFYKLSAPNYSEPVLGCYELNITHTLSQMTVSDIEYESGSILAKVLTQLEDKTLGGYTIFTLSEADKKNTPESLLRKYIPQGYDSYIALGKHYVFVLIKPEMSKYIVWDGSIPSDQFENAPFGGINRKFLKVEFNIVATENREVVPLSVNKWQFGEFTREDNSPNWRLMFNIDYSKFEFVLTSKSDGTDKYYFYGDPDKALGVNELGFDKAPAGDYILTATAPSDGESVKTFVKECDVTVDKADLRFVDGSAPFVDSWNYGNYKSELLNPAYTLGGLGSEVKHLLQVKYCTKAEYDKTNPRLTDLSALLDGEGQLPADTYYLVYTFEGNDNFNSWQYGVRFKVNRAENYWDITPVIHDWAYGTFDSASFSVDCAPHFGSAENVRFQFKNDTELSTWLDDIKNLNGYETSGQLAVGTYRYRAVIPVSGNYNALVFEATFSVTKAVNGWVEVPGIKGWAYGNFSSKENRPYATAQVGNNTIVYTVTDEEGNTYDINKLKDLKIGSYILTATIAGTDNYEELTSVVYFNVVEDSVGLTGLMVTTIVFAAVALGLVVAGVVLLILRNRKAEAEFRKAIKNELRRK